MMTVDGLTSVERHVQRAQVQEHRCGVCVYRLAEIVENEWACSKGLRWPPGRRRSCERFVLDEEA